MLTFSYMVGGWVWQNAYVINRIIKNTKFINVQRKVARVHNFFSHNFWKQTIDVQSGFTIYEFTSVISFEAEKSVSNKYFSSPFRSHIEKWQDNGQKNYGVGGFSKILRNSQSGSWQMLTSDYKVGGWGEKRPKTCLCNIWMVPNNQLFCASTKGQ